MGVSVEQYLCPEVVSGFFMELGCNYLQEGVGEVSWVRGIYRSMHAAIVERSGFG